LEDIDMKPYTKIIVWIVVSALVLSGCGSLGEEPTATPESSRDEDFNPIISATGVVVPELWATLSMPGQGLVVETLVGEGDHVTAGQALARLDITDAQLNVEQAEADLAAVQIRYDQAPTAEPARKQADITAATLALLQAQDALADLDRAASLEAARAQLTVATAQKALKDAQRDRTNMNYPRANQTTIDGAKAFYELKEEELEKAKQEYNNVRDLPADDLERNMRLLDQSDAQKARDKALATLNWYLGKNSEVDLAEADAKLALAQAELEIAQEELGLVKDGPAETDVALAQEKIANAQALLDLANAQSVEQQIALVKIQLDAAKARLELAQAQLDKLTVKAPFDGIVTSVKVKPGEWVMMGQPAMVLAGLDNLKVETTDLSEIDAARLQLGDQASVTFDALPGISVGGTIQRIALKSAEGSGVNYTVSVLIEDLPDELRWGMTAFVDVEVDN
jgi:multidrug efflux pump subunit AcrA (membrane-fusion protein)